MTIAARTAHGIGILCVVFAATALAIGSAQYAFGLFIAPLEETFGWTRTQISLSASFAAVGGLSAPMIGRFMDRYGARPVLVVSLVISGFGFVLRPLMSELWHWYALSFLQFAAFSGMTVLPTGRLVSAWFPSARGRMLGIAAMGNNFGGLTVPVLVAAILSVASWRESFVAIGLSCFVVALLAWLVVRDSPAAYDEQSANDMKSESPSFQLSGATAREALTSRSFYAVLTVVTLGYFTYSTILTHALAHLLNKGMSTATASYSLSALAVGGLAGKLVFGAMVDRFGARFASTFNLSGQAVFAVLLATVDTHTALMLTMPVFGLFMGGFGVVSTVLVQDTFGMRYFGSIMGLMSLSTVVAFGIGPVLAGLSYDHTGSYSAAFVVVACFFLVGVTTLILSPIPRWAGQ